MEQQACECGCGGYPKGARSRLLPGHDAKKQRGNGAQLVPANVRPPRSESTLVAAAGEYYVLSQLCLKGFIAALSPKGVPNTDIVVSDVQSRHLFSVQVKTRRDIGADKGWHMKPKHADLHSDTLFYCFVDFVEGPESRPVTYVVPSRVIADVLSYVHPTWLAIPGKNGREHRDSNVRRLVPDYSRYLGERCGQYGPGWLECYREAWHLLK